MPAVFVSYAREDQPFVRRLHEALASQGRDAWVDWEGIPPSAEWMAEIRRAIDGADAAVFVLSPDWASSQICGIELEHAVLQGKRLVPVIWRDAPIEQVPEALAKLNWVMLREADDFEQGMARLVAALDTDLDWVREHTRLLVRAQRWQDRGRDDANLLRGRELDEAERWLAAGAAHQDPAPVPLQAALVGSSRAAATRRQRIVRALGIAALVTTTT
ncbi:MAG TPA: toll/interleukin-1 receptor domain-containing protein, partial [Ideonella sp.]|nr:toll/interleukin-1 receptor domain-containing protein [Ideonella sp.]